MADWAYNPVDGLLYGWDNDLGIPVKINTLVQFDCVAIMGGGGEKAFESLSAKRWARRLVASFEMRTPESLPLMRSILRVETP